MKTRSISLILAIILLAACIPFAALAEDNTPSPSAGYYYVNTDNGKSLNVRDTPGGKVVGSLKNGTRIYCYYKDGGNGWALIDYKYNMPGYGVGTYACFISSRYLSKSKPEDKSGSKSGQSAADPMSEINAEFRAAKTVTPYSIYVRPTRASGWVNLRWAPTKSAEVMNTYKANAQLTVIRELRNWYQVEDPVTGYVGFMDKAFVVR